MDGAYGSSARPFVVIGLGDSAREAIDTAESAAASVIIDFDPSDAIE